MKKKQGFVLSLFLIWAMAAQAKTFSNAYVSFELPDAWNCKLEHTDWVCRSEIEKQTREAIIILTAKEVGPTDSLEQYMSHLNQVQQTAFKGAGANSSRVIYQPKKAQVNNQTWVDGLHLGSEVPNYFTRYLATVKDRIAILVTLSAHKDFYTQYSPQFFKAVASLRVIATNNMLSRPEVGPPGGAQGVFGSSNVAAALGEPMDAGGATAAPEGQAHKGQSTQLLFLILAVILAAAAGYLYMKTKKKK